VSQESILVKIAAGDPAATSECVNRYKGLIWSITKGFISNPADAEDAVQDIFIAIWQSAGRYNPDIAAESTFISTIARRRLIDKLRHSRRQPGLDSIDADETGTLLPVEESTQSQSAEVRCVSRIMADMKPQHRTILSMSLYQGYSHSEISKRLRIPLGTIKTRVRRGVIHIREQLKCAPITA